MRDSSSSGRRDRRSPPACWCCTLLGRALWLVAGAARVTLPAYSWTHDIIRSSGRWYDVTLPMLLIKFKRADVWNVIAFYRQKWRCPLAVSFLSRCRHQKSITRRCCPPLLTGKGLSAGFFYFNVNKWSTHACRDLFRGAIRRMSVVPECVNDFSTRVWCTSLSFPVASLFSDVTKRARGIFRVWKIASYPLVDGDNCPFNILCS